MFTIISIIRKGNRRSGFVLGDFDFGNTDVKISVENTEQVLELIRNEQVYNMSVVNGQILPNFNKAGYISAHKKMYPVRDITKEELVMAERSYFNLMPSFKEKHVAVALGGSGIALSCSGIDEMLGINNVIFKFIATSDVAVKFGAQLRSFTKYVDILPEMSPTLGMFTIDISVLVSCIPQLKSLFKTFTVLSDISSGRSSIRDERVLSYTGKSGIPVVSKLLDELSNVTLSLERSLKL